MKALPKQPTLLGTCFLALLLCSCVGTSLKETWKSPDYHAGYVGKIAAIAVDERGELRRGFENRFVAQLKERKAPAIVTYDLLSLPEIKADKVAAAEHFRSVGADTVLVIRQVESGTSYTEHRHSVGQPWSAAGDVSWYDYYSLAFTQTSYASYKQTARLETSLFDLKTEKRIWSALTDTVATETMDRIAEMDKIVTKAVAAMQKDGMIP